MTKLTGELTPQQQLSASLQKADNKLSGGNLVEQGPRGLSAYEMAVKNGYVGTEQEWLKIHLQRNELEIVTKEEAKQDFNRINNGEINETVV